MKDIYDHFNNRWVSAQDLGKKHNFKHIAIECLWGLLASVMIFFVSLTILCGLIGG